MKDNFEGNLKIDSEHKYNLIRKAIESLPEDRGYIELILGQSTFYLYPSFIRFKGIGKEAFLKGHLATKQ